jgi:hypothetical protein
MLTKPIFLTTSFLFRFILLLALITVNLFSITHYQLISLLASSAILILIVLHTNLRPQILKIDAKVQSATTKAILFVLFLVAYLLNFLPAMLLNVILQRRAAELFTSTEFDFNSPYRVRRE